jgi:hypothetical protein
MCLQFWYFSGNVSLALQSDLGLAGRGCVDVVRVGSGLFFFFFFFPRPFCPVLVLSRRSCMAGARHVSFFPPLETKN